MTLIGRLCKCFFVFMLVAALYMQAQHDSKIDIETGKETYKEIWLNVYVHGIISLKYHLSFSNIIRFIQDRVAGSAYAKTVEYMRLDPYFYLNHPMQEPGLQKISLQEVRRGAAACAFAQLWERIDAENRSAGVNIENRYYTFGWTGLLSPTMRILEAHMLYKLLVAERDLLIGEGITPKIRLVCYSHGGNLGLNLPLDEVKERGDLVIDELVLVGVPVIKENDHFVFAPMFKRVFHVYSTGDRVQQLDFFSLKRFFSRRLFSPLADKLPSKITQIQLRVKRLAKHTAKKCKGKVKKDHCCFARKALRTADPGHTELWSFGWGASSFSPKNPLAPLPAALLIPYVINALKAEGGSEGMHMAADIYPFCDTLFLRCKDTGRTKVVPFLSQQTLADLCAFADQFKPEEYSQEVALQRVAQARERAEREVLQSCHSRR